MHTVACVLITNEQTFLQCFKEILQEFKKNVLSITFMIVSRADSNIQLRHHGVLPVVKGL